MTALARTLRSAAPSAPEDQSEGRPEDAERRIEDWIVSNLDGDASDRPGAYLDGLLLKSPVKRKGAGASPSPSPEPPVRPWKHFAVAKLRGITIVKLVDSNLIRDTVLHELGDELAALIDSGARRLVVDFQRVERLSSHLVASLAEAYARCTATVGGLLRVCRLNPEIAPVFSLVGRMIGIEAFADEKTAVEAPWPGPTLLLPLPVSILSALAAGESGVDLDTRGIASDSAPALDDDQAEALAAAPPVVLVGDDGRMAPVGPGEFSIGREEACDLWLDLPSVSRRHAAIENFGRGVTLRDLGSTNGTILNGRTLRKSSELLRNGDRIEVGGHRFVVSIGDAARFEEAVEDHLLDWLGTHSSPMPEDLDDDEDAAETPTLTGAETLDLGIASVAIKCERIEDVLLVTPMLPHLDEESAVNALREALLDLLDRGLPTRLVVNLPIVERLSSGAIGVLLAHQLRLHRLGGAMRLVQVQPLVRTYLTHIRLPMLVEIHETLDDAVLTSW